MPACTLGHILQMAAQMAMAYFCGTAVLPACLPAVTALEQASPLPPVGSLPGCTAFLEHPFSMFCVPGMLEAMVSIMQHLLQEEPMVEPEYMLSKGLWEDVALPALKKVGVSKPCAQQFSLMQP